MDRMNAHWEIHPMKINHIAAIVALVATLSGSGCRRAPKEVERPEKIVSLRHVAYDSATYAKLAQLWEKYYDAYPSEDAYANWMYAARYADSRDIESMLARGVEKYPANPVLLYLLGCTKNGGHDSQEGRQLLQKAAALDQTYLDPWYGLAVNYIIQGDRENADAALRHILNGGDVEDVVMDLSYNMLASVDTNAILITNGDNDTFPGWILTRILRFRPDVNVVNRSLLNLDSYASSIEREGVPQFISHDGLDSLKALIPADGGKVRSGQMPGQDFVVLGDRLISRIIAAAERAGRPVYFACTMGSPGPSFHIDLRDARGLGLVTRVTSSTSPYTSQLQKLFTTWTTVYRTGGLDSWRLHAAGEMSAGRLLAGNYAVALSGLISQIGEAGPDTQLSLFRWYRTHLVDLLHKNSVDKLNSIWFDRKFPREIREWSRSKGWLGD